MRIRILTSAVLIASCIARGNDTALHDGRFGPEPLGAAEGKESPVRMEREHLQISFGYRYTTVHCKFTFRNTEPQGQIEQLVGFPDIGAASDEMRRREPQYADTVGERVNTGRLLKMQTFVGGKEAKTELRFGDVKLGGDVDGTTVWAFDRQSGVRAWHVLKVNFPAGRLVTVERRYRVENGTSALGVAFFQYTTATGGVWKGTIGRLQADVVLKEGLKVRDLVWLGARIARVRLKGEYAQFATQPARGQWHITDAKHLHLIWRNFEPRTEQNRRGFSLARPFHGWD